MAVPQRQHKRTESFERAARNLTGYRSEGKMLKRKLVRSKGLEPLRAFTHQLLRLARLPIPPRPQAAILTAALGTSEMFMTSVQRNQVRAAPRLPVLGPKKRPAQYVGPAVNDFPRLLVVLNDRRGGSMIFGRRYPDLQGSSLLLRSFAFCGRHLRAW